LALLDCVGLFKVLRRRPHYCLFLTVLWLAHNGDGWTGRTCGDKVTDASGFFFSEKGKAARIVIIITACLPARPSLLPCFARAPLCAKHGSSLRPFFFALLRVLFSPKKRHRCRSRNDEGRGRGGARQKEEEEKRKDKVRVRSINIFPQKGDPTAHLE
jgi:hypothetical protein